ncbi:MAG: hypothetical protein ACHQLQ_09480 [Candidatus Acidiferrales bacterium]
MSTKASTAALARIVVRKTAIRSTSTGLSPASDAYRATRLAA